MLIRDRTKKKLRTSRVHRIRDLKSWLIVVFPKI
jgi:hypothetical protein